MAAPFSARMSLEEYIAFESTAEERHEFFAGEIFAMSGGTIAHADITENLSIRFGNALTGSPCRGRSSDLRVRILATGFSTYPDYLIICGTPEVAPDDAQSVTNPVAIFEVLSPTTERHDRTFKFDQYVQIPSLRYYGLIAQDAVRVEIFHRTEAGWVYRVFTDPTEIITFENPDVTIAVGDLYADVSLPPQTSGGAS